MFNTQKCSLKGEGSEKPLTRIMYHVPFNYVKSIPNLNTVTKHLEMKPFYS